MWLPFTEMGKNGKGQLSGGQSRILPWTCLVQGAEEAAAYSELLMPKGEERGATGGNLPNFVWDQRGHFLEVYF